jgi:hypothetical protein
MKASRYALAQNRVAPASAKGQITATARIAKEKTVPEGIAKISRVTYI